MPLLETAREWPPPVARSPRKVPAIQASKWIWALQEMPWRSVGLQSVPEGNQPASLIEMAPRPSVFWVQV
jgi:hypothetical protein